MEETVEKVLSIRQDLHRRFGRFDCSLFALMGMINRLHAMNLRTTDCPIDVYHAEINDLLMMVHKWLDGTAIDKKET